jgi:hypothetical protein
MWQLEDEQTLEFYENKHIEMLKRNGSKIIRGLD